MHTNKQTDAISLLYYKANSYIVSWLLLVVVSKAGVRKLPGLGRNFPQNPEGGGGGANFLTRGSFSPSFLTSSPVVYTVRMSPGHG